MNRKEKAALLTWKVIKQIKLQSKRKATYFIETQRTICPETLKNVDQKSEACS